MRSLGWRRVPMLGAVAALAVLASGCSLWGWGANSLGTVGDGTTANPRPSPVQVAGDWSAVASGNGHTCGIAQSDSTLWCWGDNYWGTMGDTYTGEDPRPSPVQIGTATWNVISAG